MGPADGNGRRQVNGTAVLPGDSADARLPFPSGAHRGDDDFRGHPAARQRSTGGGEDTNNDFLLTRIFAQPDANPKTTTNNSPTHVSVVVDHIMAQRAIYVIYAEQVGGDSDDITDLANVGRQNAWKSINDFVRITSLTGRGRAGRHRTTTRLVEDVTPVATTCPPAGSFFSRGRGTASRTTPPALDRSTQLRGHSPIKYAFEAAGR